MMLSVGQRVIPIGEGPCMECPACGQRVPFDLRFSYYSLRLGALGASIRWRWRFHCRACRQSWLAKRSVARELERAGAPIPLLERDGLLIALFSLALLLLLLRT